MENTKKENMQSTNNSTVSNFEAVENYFCDKHTYWNSRIKELNSLMNELTDVLKLTNQIYTLRQEAVEYYYALFQTLSHQTEKYKKKYAECYNRIKVNSQIRYTTESAINTQIENELSDIKERIDLVNNQTRYMENTIKTIDDMIYGIKYRIDISKLINKADF